jgi:hypothetical protein
MSYLIAVLVDRFQAETAYTELEKAGLPLDKVDILGKGYKSADEFGLIDPNQVARDRMKQMALWIVPFGFAAGTAFSLATNLHTFAWAGEVGDRLLGGVMGAIGGAMGSVFVGGGIGTALGSGDALPYRNRLNAGKYLVVVTGSPNLLQQSRRILNRCNPESLQEYVDMS